MYIRFPLILVSVDIGCPFRGTRNRHPTSQVAKDAPAQGAAEEAQAPAATEPGPDEARFMGTYGQGHKWL